MPRIVLAVLRNSVLRVQVFACPVLNCWPPPPPVDIKVALQDALHGYCRYNVFLCHSICSVTYSCLTALVSNAPGDDEERYLCQMNGIHASHAPPHAPLQVKCNCTLAALYALEIVRASYAKVNQFVIS